MIKDHNLDDLIIDDIQPEKNKSKGILTILALLIILLIVAIIMTRMFLGENDKNSTVVEQKQEDLISPELKLDTSGHNQEADKKELDQLSSVMEETPAAKPANAPIDLSQPSSTTQAEQIKPETTQIDEASQPNTTLTPNEATTIEPAKEEVALTQETSLDAPTEAIADAPQPAKEALDVAEENLENITEAPKKQEAEEVIETPAPKPVTKSASRKPSTSSSYYIQVGSFTSQPSKQFLSVITKSGFQYKLDKGKLLIGPYSNDAAAKKDLPNVRNKINKSAFIKHL